MGKVIDFWTGREHPLKEPQHRINQATLRQLCQIAAYSEVLGLLTPDDLQKVIREYLPRDSNLYCHPFEMTSQQAYRLVGLVREAARRAGSFGKGRRRAADYVNHGAPDKWTRPHGYNSRVPKLRQGARARAQLRR